jgi:Flp pilus assembly protein TadG
MRRTGARLYADECGGALAEAAIVLPLFLVFVFGSVDFLMAMYQWNAATKAVQLGARIAAVSSPVSSDIATLTGLGGGVNPGDAMPSFTRTCDGGSATCSGGGTFDSTALNTIVYGRGNGATCTATNNLYRRGMCHAFARVTPANVVVSYTQTGLGYAGRPGGPVPTITVSLQNVSFQYYFLGGLIGLNNITIPGLTTSITGEDLASSGP